MNYNTRFAPETIRAGIIADHEAGMPVAEIQGKYNVCETTVRRWVKRRDPRSKSSRPLRQPRRLTAEVEARIVEARQQLQWGPDRLAMHLGMASSTVHKVLVRYGINKLAPKCKLPSIRYEHATPGALVHVDVKKLGTMGLYSDPHKRRHGPGYECLHIMLDDCSRTTYTEIHPNETATTASAFLERATQWFNSLGVSIERVLSDRGPAYISLLWRDTCQLLNMRHQLIRPRRPQTNGKCERWIRTLVDESLRGRAYGTLEARARVIDNYVSYYNSARQHTALDGLTPLQRLCR